MTSWLPQTPDGAPREPWAVVIGVHGMNDYSNAFHLAAPYWAADGIATYAYDQRGFGRSPGRGVWGGDALMTEDLRTLTALVRQRYPRAIIAVAGVSLGGAVAIEAFASDRPPVADRLVLLSDGIPEAMNPGGQLYGFERLHDLMQSRPSAAELAAAAQAFGQQDDISVISITRTAAPGEYHEPVV